MAETQTDPKAPETVTAEQNVLSRVWANLKHPAAVTLLGFLLTTFIGNQYDHRLKERARLATLEEHSLAQLNAFAELVYERQVRTDMVRSAVARRMGDEAIARKVAYDAVYVRWNTEIYAHIQSLRSLVGQEFQLTPYDQAINKAILPSLGCSDALVTRAYDWAHREGFARAPAADAFAWSNCLGQPVKNWQKVMKTQRDRVRLCTHAILDNMMPQIRSLSTLEADQIISKPKREAQNQAILAQLATVCGFKAEGV